MPVLLPEEYNVALPEMTAVRQIFDMTCTVDVEKCIAEELSKPEIEEKIKPGQRVAVAVGSRGIHQIGTIVRAAIGELRARGAEPFIVSAMGSHGGGTEEGQREILTGYGITEAAMGVPVLVSMDVVEIGRTKGGQPVYTDRTAYEADMTVLINRIKPHTDFTGPIESGLCKMAVIGLGNHKGCAAIHQAGMEGFSDTLREAAELVLREGNVGFGIGIVENAAERTLHVEAVPAESITDREPKLLELAKARMARLYFEEIDVLIIEEIGKNISGAGADSNIIGRVPSKRGAPGIPRIGFLIILGLSEQAHGNAVGIGLADFTVRGLVKGMDFESTYANCLASKGLNGGRLPFIMEDEREAVAAAVKMWGAGDPSRCRIVRIKNTMELEHIQVSAALMSCVKSRPEFFEIESRP